MNRTMEEVQEDIRGCIRRGEHEMEAGYPYENNLNDYQRDLIAAFAAKHGQSWLGRVNIYDNDKHLPIIWQWDGGLVYNFGASFIIPKFDDELYALILARHYAPYTGTREDYKRINAIYARLEALGGESLIWN